MPWDALVRCAWAILISQGNKLALTILVGNLLLAAL